MEVAPFFVDFHHFLSIFTIFYRFSRFMHFCRDLHFVAIYAVFLQIFFGQSSLLRNITRFLHVWSHALPGHTQVLFETRCMLVKLKWRIWWWLRLCDCNAREVLWKNPILAGWDGLWSTLCIFLNIVHTIPIQCNAMYPKLIIDRRHYYHMYIKTFATKIVHNLW